jgi:DNA-binding response OmpR family regulator
MSRAANRSKYHFGSFVLDPASRALLRNGKLLAVSSKVFDCIVYLVENRDRAVGATSLLRQSGGKPMSPTPSCASWCARCGEPCRTTANTRQ